MPTLNDGGDGGGDDDGDGDEADSRGDDDGSDDDEKEAWWSRPRKAEQSRASLRGKCETLAGGQGPPGIKQEEDPWKKSSIRECAQI